MRMRRTGARSGYSLIREEDAVDSKSLIEISVCALTFSFRPLLVEKFGPTNPAGFVGPEHLSVLVVETN